MTKKAVLITGAGGEMGHGLIDYLAKENKYKIIALDLNEVKHASSDDFVSIKGDILNRDLLEDIFAKYNIEQVFHFAAILSSGGERNPEKTHQVNVEGSMNLLSLAKSWSQKSGKPITFLFPSTIAVYGIKDRATKDSAGKVREDQFMAPVTIYGANKFYIEQLGCYYSEFYKLLDENPEDVKLDFRAIRFPGLMSADTLPSGGTSDYGSEMIHAAVQGKAYECFVTPDSRLPFMTMTDAIRALIELSRAPASSITQRAYNIAAFSVTASDIRDALVKRFPKTEISYSPHPKRNSIVATWPGDIDDSAARRDWGWKPNYDFQTALDEYLIPGISAHYRK